MRIPLYKSRKRFSHQLTLAFGELSWLYIFNHHSNHLPHVTGFMSVASPNLYVFNIEFSRWAVCEMRKT